MKTVLLAGVASLALAGIAQAGTCTTDEANGITVNVGCEVGSVNNDFLGAPPIQVNIDALFTFTDWEFVAKDNDLDGTDEGDLTALTIVGDAISGTWSIASSVFDTYSDVMLVQKSGSGNTTQPNYIGYLVTAMSGDYTTAYFNPNNGNGKDISHISLYGRGDGGGGPMPPVPVPAAGLLLLTGAGAFGALRLRRKS